MSRLKFFDHDRVVRYFAMLEEIIERAPVRLVAASYSKHPWPYRLQNYDGCYRASFQWSNVRILDSGFNNPEITNEDVLAKAIKRGATEVVAKDYLPGQTMDYQAKTTESIREFIDLHDPDEHPPAWIPLQPPYDEHYHEVAPIVEESHLQPRYMLGGLAKTTARFDATAETRLELLRDFRAVAPHEVAHGLGWGLQPELVMELREDPGLLDSLDTSGPSNCIRRSDRIIDANWDERDFEWVHGDLKGAIGGLGELLMWFQGAHRLSMLSEEYDPAKKLHDDQTQLPGLVDD